ncbi:MAG: sugar transporter [Chloroflexi bacterium]|nr:sugar transporter [Chloroflexota bacterium]
MASDQSDDKVFSSKKTRRDVLKAGAAGAAGIAAAGAIGPVAKAMAAPAIVTRAPQTITLMSWFQFEAGRNTAWFQLIKDFHASQSDYRIKWTGWTADHYTSNVLVQQQSGGISADVLTLIPDLAYRLVQTGALAPIDDIIKKLGVHPSPAHDFLRKGGHLYGINTVEVPFAVVYNKQLTDKAGIKKLATTPAEWKTQLRALTHKPTQFGIWQPNSPSEVFSWWFELQNYCLMYDTLWAVGKKAMVNSPKIVAALEVWLEQYQNSMAVGATNAVAQKLFDNGQIAETLNVSAAVNQYKVTAPKLFANIRSAPPPWPTKKSLSRLHPLSIVASTKKMDGAKAFTEFMAAPANNAKLMMLCLDVIPSYPEILKVPGVNAWLANQTWAKGYQEIVHVPFPTCEGDFIAHDTEFGNIVTQNFEQALFGNVTVKAAMDAAQRQIEDASNRWFK